MEPYGAKGQMSTWFDDYYSEIDVVDRIQIGIQSGTSHLCGSICVAWYGESCMSKCLADIRTPDWACDMTVTTGNNSLRVDPLEFKFPKLQRRDVTGGQERRQLPSSAALGFVLAARGDVNGSSPDLVQVVPQRPAIVPVFVNYSDGQAFAIFNRRLAAEVNVSAAVCRVRVDRVFPGSDAVSFDFPADEAVGRILRTSNVPPAAIVVHYELPHSLRSRPFQGSISVAFDLSPGFVTDQLGEPSSTGSSRTNPIAYHYDNRPPEVAYLIPKLVPERITKTGPLVPVILAKTVDILLCFNEPLLDMPPASALPAQADDAMGWLNATVGHGMASISAAEWLSPTQAAALVNETWSGWPYAAALQGECRAMLNPWLRFVVDMEVRGHINFTMAQGVLQDLSGNGLLVQHHISAHYGKWIPPPPLITIEASCQCRHSLPAQPSWGLGENVTTVSGTAAPRVRVDFVFSYNATKAILDESWTLSAHEMFRNMTLVNAELLPYLTYHELPYLPDPPSPDGELYVGTHINRTFSGPFLATVWIQPTDPGVVKLLIPEDAFENDIGANSMAYELYLFYGTWHTPSSPPFWPVLPGHTQPSSLRRTTVGAARTKPLL